MSSHLKGVILGILTGMVICSIGFLFQRNPGEFVTFTAQSIVDNAIFCVMFIIVVYVTGVSV